MNSDSSASTASAMSGRGLEQGDLATEEVRPWTTFSSSWPERSAALPARPRRQRGRISDWCAPCGRCAGWSGHPAHRPALARPGRAEATRLWRFRPGFPRAEESHGGTLRPQEVSARRAKKGRRRGAARPLGSANAPARPCEKRSPALLALNPASTVRHQLHAAARWRNGWPGVRPTGSASKLQVSARQLCH